MDVYEKARELARMISESEEGQTYRTLQQRAYDDSTNKALLDEYKRLQYRLQVAMASGGSAAPEDMQRLQAIGNLLQFNSDASDYMLAEFRFQRMIADVYKIIGEGAGLDLDMLKAQ